ANHGAAATKNWRLEFTLPATAKLGTFWDASVSTGGSKIVATDRGYNANVSAGAATSFGFIGSGRGAPTAAPINGAPRPAGTGGPGPAPRATGAPARSATRNPPKPSPTKPSPSPTKTQPAPAPGGNGILVAPYVDMGLTSNGGSLQQLSAGSGIKSFT